LAATISSEGEKRIIMHVSRALLKNTKASLHFHRRFFIFLVALLIIVVALIAVAASLPQIITAGNTDTGIGTSGYASGAYIFETHTDHEGSPTPTPTPNVTFPPLVDAPEYGIGGGLVALFICFAAFTVYMKRAKPSQKLA
jgi:hypothetical protein